MRNASIVLGLMGLFAAPVACSSTGGDASNAGQASATDDFTLARANVTTLSDRATGKCKTCHAASEAKVTKWGKSMHDVYDNCLDPNLNRTALERVNCLRGDATDPASSFSANKLGLYAAGANTQEFQDLFKAAYPTEFDVKFKEFLEQASMPVPGDDQGVPLTDAEFAKLKAWGLKGMPMISQAYRNQPPPADPGPTSCTDNFSADLKSHLDKMKTEGWAARLADANTVMLGCGSATNPMDCFKPAPGGEDRYAEKGAFANTDLPQTMRVVRDLPFRTTYWVRSSADGRFTGFGLRTRLNGAPGAITDHVLVAKGDPRADIPVQAPYDPIFFPSNDGFSFAGTSLGIAVCKQSLLTDPISSVTFGEAKCASAGRSVYQSVGSSLDGSKYFVTFGTHENDDGGNSITAPQSGNFSADSKVTVVPMVNDGASYKASTPTIVTTPYEGDHMVSPSGRVVVTRFGAAGKQLGYSLRFLNATPNGAAYDVKLDKVAEVCITGAKAGFSYDERFLVTHQYADPTNPDLAGLPAGSSNVILVDLLTGKKYRITTMGANQFALYPHFRADGWLYFLVRDMGGNKEYLMATDAALRISATP